MRPLAFSRMKADNGPAGPGGPSAPPAASPLAARRHFMRRCLASRRLLALLLLAALLPAASSARAQVDVGPTLVVDAPGAGAAVVAPVLLIGWAIGPESPSGTGVDAVAVYLDGPVGVGAPLGRALYGQTRPDVARARGDSRYAPSGWALQADLPAGPRQLYVYAHLAERPDDQGWTERM